MGIGALLLFIGVQTNNAGAGIVGFVLGAAGVGMVIGASARAAGRASVASPLLPPIELPKGPDRTLPMAYSLRNPDRVAPASDVLGFRRINPQVQPQIGSPNEGDDDVRSIEAR